LNRIPRPERLARGGVALRGRTGCVNEKSCEEHRDEDVSHGNIS